MKKIAVFGGTFNPVHNGHMALCQKCISLFNFDKILLVPSNIPPHKPAVDLASNEDRFNMLKIASKNNDKITVSDIEFKLGAKSYTINTIEALKKEYKGYDIYLIIGSDMLKSFDKWKDYKKLLEYVTLLVGARSREDQSALESIKDSFGIFSKKIEIVNLDIVELSSTQIREDIAKKKDVSLYLPDGVYEYIIKKDLY